MTVIRSPHEYTDEQVFVDLWPTLGVPLHLKCEGFNFAGSIKMKPAVEMVEAAEAAGVLRPGSILVESSSGNLGVALAMIAASKGYDFVCVTDSRCNRATRRVMTALGARVVVVSEPDPVGGLLGARLVRIAEMCAKDDRHVWLDQYRNPGNWRAHYRRTAPAVAAQFPDLDVLFVGAGTCGTLMGCARFFREWHRPVRVVAVDAVGSVTFGGLPAPRFVPGLGSALVPPALDASVVDDTVMVAEVDTVLTCRRLARHGFLLGGSTGTVVSAATTWLAEHDPDGRLTAVAVSPDLGERYLDTVYDTSWVAEVVGEELVAAQSR